MNSGRSNRRGETSVESDGKSVEKDNAESENGRRVEKGEKKRGDFVKS